MYELLILGMLMTRDMTGYKLRKVLESALVPRRELSNGVMYPLLAKLEQQGYIQYRENTSDPRGSKLAHVTETGVTEFHHLMTLPVADDAKRESIYRFKLRGMSHVTRKERIQVLRDYEATIQTDQNIYEKVLTHLQEMLANTTIKPDSLRWGIQTLKLSITICQAKQAWVEQCRIDMNLEENK